MSDSDAADECARARPQAAAQSAAKKPSEERAALRRAAFHEGDSLLVGSHPRSCVHAAKADQVLGSYEVACRVARESRLVMGDAIP